MRELLRDRRFLLLFFGQTVNMIGDRALLVVLGIYVKELTGSDTMAGVVFILLAVPSFFAPLTGLLVDRFPRRCCSSGIRAICGSCSRSRSATASPTTSSTRPGAD
jgi:MFS family permease